MLGALTTRRDTKMNAAIDLVALRMVTEGDHTLECELHTLFQTTTQGCLDAMEAEMQSPSQEGWREAVHCLKGAASSLGAIRLAELCAEAEQMHVPEKRELMFSAIQAEAVRVDQFLADIIQGAGS